MDAPESAEHQGQLSHPPPAVSLQSCPSVSRDARRPAGLIPDPDSRVLDALALPDASLAPPIWATASSSQTAEVVPPQDQKHEPDVLSPQSSEL